MKLSKNFHGMELPCRTKIGVAGCKNSCTSVYSKDVGVITDLDGKMIVTVGGSAGYNQRRSDIVTKGLNEKEVFDLIKVILDYYNEEAYAGEKLGEFLDRISIEILLTFLQHKDRNSTRLNSSHKRSSRMPSSA